MGMVAERACPMCQFQGKSMSI